MTEVKDSDGTFDKWQFSQQQCPKCRKHNVLCRKWESSDGAYEDWQYMCQNPTCGHNQWVEGVDS